MRRALAIALLAAAALGLTGCASETVWRPVVENRDATDAPFDVTGRLSVNFDGKGQMAGFDWRHQPGRDELDVKTPLGSTVARLVRDVSGVELTSDGKTYRAPDVDTLTEERLGFPLPMANLAWWVRGRAAPGAAAETLPDGTLVQDGWRIRFTRDADQPSPYPKRIDLSRERLTLRLVMQQWR
ncbi:lipoprotein insertase outer membrane protein LolB [Paludibacterium paludis]|uniref:Outer-membrane lipoprotein LolB n=1 Tax=Paludibacterium paludis TaxID=1225769 RepID=A0A918NZP8_9NEIS|nr:lipoprotein insertase outer membrane protein LolB [Paludibacterium paludis]GGY08500.1 outer-membrane lipoprotein LolB [Paludibacterium paludis]